MLIPRTSSYEEDDAPNLLDFVKEATLILEANDDIENEENYFFNIFLAVNYCYWKSCWHCLYIIILDLSLLSQLGLTNRCPLYKSKKHINAKQFDIAIN